MKRKEGGDDLGPPLFDGLSVSFHYDRHVKKLKSLVVSHGGQVVDDFSDGATHRIVGPNDTSEDLRKVVQDTEDGGEPQVYIRSTWLSECLKVRKRIPSERFEVRLPSQPSTSTLVRSEAPSAPPSTTPKQPSAQSEVERKAENTIRKLRACWTNARLEEGGDGPSTASDADEEPTNMPIVEELKRLVDLYRNDPRNDKHGFRAKAVNRAISILSRPPFGPPPGRQIKRAAEILSDKYPQYGGSFPGGVGLATAGKVHELLCSPDFQLQRVKAMENDPLHQTIRLFSSVWGIGVETAKRYYTAGLRTLDDIKAKVKLSKMQTLGLQYFEHLSEPITRQQMEEAREVIRRACDGSAAKGSVCGLELCGSYRRGKTSTHDVDVVIFVRGEDNVDAVASALVDALTQNGFLLDFLYREKNAFEDTADAGRLDVTRTVMGICRFPSGQIGRVDIKVYPEECKPFALMHCTGSACFNRAIKYWCIRGVDGEGGKDAGHIARVAKEASPGPAVRRFVNLSGKASCMGTAKGGHWGQAEDHPNTLKLTDTTLLPVFRARVKGKLITKVIWEANAGDCIKCETEEDVFNVLGLDYVPPEMRKIL